MKKWQQNNLLKHHQSRVKNAKSTFSATVRSSQGARSNSNSSKIKEKQANVTELSIFASPLYSILLTFGLEEYADALIDLDYGYDFNKFQGLKGLQKERLLDKIGVKGRNRYKMATLFQYLADMVMRMNQLQTKKVPRSPYMPPMPKRSNPIKQKQKERVHKLSPYNPLVLSKQTSREYKQHKRNGSTNKKSLATDDSVILHKSINGRIQANYCSKFLVQRLTRKGPTDSLNQIDLEVGRIKDMYLSLESGKLTSNITNIDIEELANCLAREFYSFIRYEVIQEQMQMKQSSTLEESTHFIAEEIESHPMEAVETVPMFPSLPRLPKILEIVDEGNQSIFQSVLETKKELIESIMKESMLRATDAKSRPSFIESDIFEDTGFDDSLRVTQGASDIQGIDSSGKNKHLKRFENRNLEEVLKQPPSIYMVEDYIKNLIFSLKMEKEAPIFTYVYFKRLMDRCNGREFNQLAWRNIVLVCLLLGSKVWDDCSLENDTISRVLPSHTALELNRLEKIFVKIINYQLTITPKQYANGYFQLRRHCKEVRHSKGLKSLTLEQISGFQRMSHKLQMKIRSQYKESLNKSF